MDESLSIFAEESKSGVLLCPIRCGDAGDRLWVQEGLVDTEKVYLSRRFG